MSDERTFFRFKRDGKVYELPDQDDFFLGEITWTSKNLGLDLSELGPVSAMMLSCFLVVRRSDPQRWNAKSYETFKTGDFEILESHPEEQGSDDPVDPTEGGTPELPATAEPSSNDSETNS